MHFQMALEVNVKMGKPLTACNGNIPPIDMQLISLRMRLPNSSSSLSDLPSIGDRITLGLKIVDSYFVEKSHGGS